MPEKDPQNYTLIQYGWVLGLALWGGVVGYLQRIRKQGEAFRLSVACAELVISGFAGVLAFFLCESMDVDGLLAAVLIAIAGHTGGAFVERLRDNVWNRYLPAPNNGNPSNTSDKGK